MGRFMISFFLISMASSARVGLEARRHLGDEIFRNVLNSIDGQKGTASTAASDATSTSIAMSTAEWQEVTETLKKHAGTGKFCTMCNKIACKLPGCMSTCPVACRR